MKKARQTVLMQGLSGFDLKCIAVFSMLVDHIGALFYPSEVWMRYVGRLAFPIFGFLIVEGFLHTKNVKQYLARLPAFPGLSEVPHDLAFPNTFVYWESQNIFFTLFLALICICAMDALKERPVFMMGILATAGACAHYVVRPDYGIGGIVMILCFYVFRTQRLEQYLSVAAINICYFGKIQRAGALALIPIWFYNGKRGPSAKYFFYLFYPVHFLLLYLIRRYLFYVV